jgi:hypothetical protein
MDCGHPDTKETYVPSHFKPDKSKKEKWGVAMDSQDFPNFCPLEEVEDE